MKNLSLLIAALALTIPAVQAKVYDITLNNADKYTQCQVKYKGSSTTKFSGKNRKGQIVTLEVKTSSILLMKEVEEEEAPAPAADTKPAPEKATKGDSAPTDNDAQAGETPKGEADADAAEKPADKPADAEEKKPGGEQPAAEEEAAASGPLGDQVQNSSVLLRKRLDGIEEELKGVRAPSLALQRNIENTRRNVTKSLEELDKLALRINELQKEYNEACMGDYAFTIVTKEQRDQYVRDGKAAHKAMVIDMKEKPGARKVGGLDKFEIMRVRYQGIPEYKESYAWYIKTLQTLEKRWGKQLEKEQARRKSLQPAKKADMAEADAKAFDKLSEEFKKDGEDIDEVWYNPNKRNLRMLNHAHNRVSDTLRRNEQVELDPAVGTVPALLEQFWDAMDKARDLMIVGSIEEAEKLLDEDTSFRQLVKLKSTIFPNDYRRPLMEQHQDIEKEIKKRARAQRSLQRKLEQQASTLERAIGNANAHIDALLADIEREKSDDTGENTVDMKQSMQEGEEDETSEK